MTDSVPPAARSMIEQKCSIFSSPISLLPLSGRGRTCAPRFFIPVPPWPPPAFAARAFRCGIRSAGTIVSDFVLKIAPLITAQTIDMTAFYPTSSSSAKRNLMMTCFSSVSSIRSIRLTSNSRLAYAVSRYLCTKSFALSVWLIGFFCCC